MAAAADPKAESESHDNAGRDVGGVLSRTLSHPDDRLHLSELLCFVRLQIEVFVVSPDIHDPRYRRLDGKVGVGRVGLRCVHCAWNIGDGGRDGNIRRSGGDGRGGPPPPPLPAPRNGAVSYPKSINVVYQSVRNWIRIHLTSCPSMPKETKERCAALQTPEGRQAPKSGMSTTRYWKECCKRIGMIDTDSGIKLRTGSFIVDEDNISDRNEGAVLSPRSSVEVVVQQVKPPSSRQCLAQEECHNRMGTIDMDNAIQPRKGHLIIEVDRSSEHDGVTEGAPQPLVEAVAQQVIPPSPIPCRIKNTRASFPLSDTLILERLSVAQGIARSMQELSPSSEDDQYDDIPTLGAKLYELFTCQPMHDPDIDLNAHARPTEGCFSTDDSVNNLETNDDRQSIQQMTKRGKRNQEGSYTRMCELGIPSALSCMVSSLLSHKNDGYQSILQVEKDLRLMAEMPETYMLGNATGKLDLANIKFCGREKEVSELLTAFDQAMDENVSTTNMVLVTGYSGTGKSTLLRRAQLGFVSKGACFVSGKFDAMQQVHPLSAIASAVNEYCDILAQDQGRMKTVRKAVKSALGSEGKILANLIPNIQKILHVGDGRHVQVQGREALQQVLFAFRMLFWATCSTTHPVVIFLDDLQWADKVSLELMEVLVTDEMIEGLLFVASYRDNEVGVDHPLMTHLGNIRRSGCVNLTSIHLGNLDIKSVNSMVSDTLQLMPGTVRPLAEAVLNKTGGNALFAVQFLASLHDEGLLHFSLVSKRWEWDINQIRAKNIADNVVELMVAKLLRLAPEVQEALSVAAGFGATCLESLLQIIDRAEDNFMSTVLALDVAVSEGLMVKSNSAYRFSHDQIQRAAYLLIPESNREKFHLRIGRLLWKSSSADELEKHIFVVVDQLHRGSSLITSCDEKVNLAELSLLAAQMAMGMSGFLAAAAHLQRGIGLLVDGDWEQNRDLCFDLYNLCAETEYILCDFEAMTEHLEEVLRRARTLQERLKAYFILVSSSAAQGRVSHSIDTALTVLAQLGEPFPAVVNEATVKHELFTTQKLLSAKKGSIDQLEPMVDKDKLEAMKFLRKLALYSWLSKRANFVLVACKMVQLTLLNGVCNCSANGFASYGLISCSFLGDVSGGYQVGKIALEIAQRFQVKADIARCQVLVYGLINQYTQPMQACLPFFKESINVGISFGANDFIMLSTQFYAHTSFLSGQPLGALWEEVQLLTKKIAGYTQHGMYAFTKLLKQVMSNLLGRSASPIKLIGEEMNEENLLSKSEDTKVRARIYFYRSWLEYLFGEYQLAFESMRNAQKHYAKDSGAIFVVQCNHIFYFGLTALALARRKQTEELMDVVHKTMAQMEQWAESCPWNCEHKLELMKAEYAFLLGDDSKASRAFEVAIDTAEKHSFLHEQAVALERAGIFYLECCDYDAASAYFQRAHDCCVRWGAVCKASHIKANYL